MYDILIMSIKIDITGQIGQDTTTVDDFKTSFLSTDRPPRQKQHPKPLKSTNGHNKHLQHISSNRYGLYILLSDPCKSFQSMSHFIV